MEDQAIIAAGEFQPPEAERHAANASRPIVSSEESPWICGLPPGDLTDQMLRDFEVYFSPAGTKWHRRRISSST